jgi:aryl-alcohol dehydrogenase-like predicted oxidoreductase
MQPSEPVAAMDYVKLGATNLQVSRLSLGGLTFGDPKWRPYALPESSSRAIISRALHHGINLFDTSNYYSLGRSEEILGAALKDLVRREDIILATKVGNPLNKMPNHGGFSRKHLLSAVDDSLRRLKTDYIDIYQIHIWMPDINLEEMLYAFDALVRSGKILYVGATVMPAWQLVRCVLTAKRLNIASLATIQNHYNLVWREDERELLPFCRHENIGLLSHSPHARGLLCGNARRAGPSKTIRSDTDEYQTYCYSRPEDYAVVDLVEDIAQKRGIKPPQVALAWVLSKGIHSPLIGATRPEHVDDAVAALSIRLAPEDMERLEKAYVSHPVSHKG